MIRTILSYSRSSVSSSRRIALSPRFLGQRYHTYPDPDEKPIITEAKSETTRTVKKEGERFEAMKRYVVDKPFEIPHDIASGSAFKEEPKTEVTKLKNGLTIATQDMPGLMCSLSFLVKTGSSAECQSGLPEDVNTGTVHMLEATAFGSTSKMSLEQLHESVEQLGGVVQCVAQRECVSYFLDTFKNNISESLDILAGAAIDSTFPDEEIENGRDMLLYSQEMVPPEMLSRDGVLIAAYGGQPMGNFHYCPAEYVPKISRDHLLRFKKKYFVPENCIVSASGVEHHRFVQAVEKTLFSRWEENTGSVPLVPYSTYTGGLHLDQRTLKDEFVRCTVGFQIGNWESQDFVVACVLQSLLGGGSSFSAGGPGKGMYTRLYREILNSFGWVESAESFISIHRDSGVFGIDGSCRTDAIAPMIQVFLDQLIKLTVEAVDDVELSRAKNMLKSMMFVQLESRLITCEDIAKQLMVYGVRKDAKTLCADIEAVTTKDIVMLARQMVQSDPSVSVIGHDVSTAPRYEIIKNFTDSYKKEIWEKYKPNIFT